MTELPESCKLTTVVPGNTKDADILITVASHSRSEWIETRIKAAQRNESRKVIRGRNRNAPCPCGCGQKAKRCKVNETRNT